MRWVLTQFSLQLFFQERLQDPFDRRVLCAGGGRRKLGGRVYNGQGKDSEQMKGSVSLEMGNPTISGDFVFILGRDRAVTGSSRPQSCRRHSASGGRRAALDPGAAGALPVESWAGSGFISLSTIFWYKALRLKGSTVKGRVPVSMAYMFTPLEGETHQTWDRKTSQEEDRAARGVGKLGPAASCPPRRCSAIPRALSSALRHEVWKARAKAQLRRVGPWWQQGLKSVKMTQMTLL